MHDPGLSKLSYLQVCSFEWASKQMPLPTGSLGSLLVSPMQPVHRDTNFLCTREPPATRPISPTGLCQHPPLTITAKVSCRNRACHSLVIGGSWGGGRALFCRQGTLIVPEHVGCDMGRTNNLSAIPFKLFVSGLVSPRPCSFVFEVTRNSWASQTADVGYSISRERQRYHQIRPLQDSIRQLLA